MKKLFTFLLIALVAISVNAAGVMICGKVYNENLFTWSIKPLPFNPDWYDEEEEEAVVPAGYANPDAYNSKGELVEAWIDSFGIVIPDKILDEDYTIVTWTTTPVTTTSRTATTPSPTPGPTSASTRRATP